MTVSRSSWSCSTGSVTARSPTSATVPRPRQPTPRYSTGWSAGVPPAGTSLSAGGEHRHQSWLIGPCSGSATRHFPAGPCWKGSAPASTCRPVWRSPSGRCGRRRFETGGHGSPAGPPATTRPTPTTCCAALVPVLDGYGVRMHPVGAGEAILLLTRHRRADVTDSDPFFEELHPWLRVRPIQADDPASAEPATRGRPYSAAGSSWAADPNPDPDPDRDADADADVAGPDPAGRDAVAAAVADELNALLLEARRVLIHTPVNEDRRRRGKPALDLLTTKWSGARQHVARLRRTRRRGGRGGNGRPAVPGSRHPARNGADPHGARRPSRR